MNEPYWWYILFVRANSEKRVASDICRAYAAWSLPYGLDAFSLETEKYYRGADLTPDKRYRKRPLLPGYLIVETDMPAAEFTVRFSDFFRNSRDVIKLLRSDQADGYSLPEDERKRFEYLYRGKRCLERSVGYMIGDKIVVEGGPLCGREAFIKHVNRHNRDAVVELEMFGRKIVAKVALEIVAKAH